MSSPNQNSRVLAKRPRMARIFLNFCWYGKIEVSVAYVSCKIMSWYTPPYWCWRLAVLSRWEVGKVGRFTAKLSDNMCEMCVIIFVTLSRTLLCWAQSVDLRNPWIALRNLWIHTLRRNPWIAQVSVDLDCLRDLPVLRTGLLHTQLPCSIPPTILSHMFVVPVQLWFLTFCVVFNILCLLLSKFNYLMTAMESESQLVMGLPRFIFYYCNKVIFFY